METYLGKNTFSRIQLVTTDDDLLSRVQPPERLNLECDSRVLSILLDLVNVDSDRAMSDSSNVSMCVDSSETSFVAHDSNAG